MHSLAVAIWSNLLTLDPRLQTIQSKFGRRPKRASAQKGQNLKLIEPMEENEAAN